MKTKHKKLRWRSRRAGNNERGVALITTLLLLMLLTGLSLAMVFSVQIRHADQRLLSQFPRFVLCRGLWLERSPDGDD